tara:strand:- start:18945 stop:20318 length:1374 start_codon:yes stop_codon:yes gene_type:complete
MKNILIVISKDIIRRNIIDTDFWLEFYKRNKKEKNTITFLVEEKRVDYFREELPADVAVRGFTRVKKSLYEKVVNFLVRTGVYSHSVTTYRMRALKRGQASLVATIVKAGIGVLFARFSWYQSFIRTLVLQITPPQGIKKVFDEGDFDSIFVPSLIDNEFDVLVAVEAKRRNIQVVGMVRSWDNLNNHGLLAVIPDIFIFQNRWLIEAAKKFQHIDIIEPEKMIVGLPHYDIYKNPKKYLVPRKVFCDALGIDSDKKILFIGGSDFYYSEDELPKILNDAIEKNEIKEPAHVIFRPHPASLFSIEEYGLNTLPHITLDPTFVNKEKVFFSDAERFVNLMYHADVVINIASTLSIDAAVFDTPAICINFDSKSKHLSYWEQVGRLYDHFDHYEKLVATGGAVTPESSEALIQNINTYFENPKKDAEGRKEVIKTFVAPFDGFSGKRLAEIVFESVCCK